MFSHRRTRKAAFIGRSRFTILLLLGTWPSPAFAGENELDRLSMILQSKSIEGRVSKTLLAKYQLDPDAELRNDFTKSPVPVALMDFEEWPSTMSGSFHFLEGLHYDSLMQALRAVRARPRDSYALIERIVAQSELWVAFDELYLDGILPDQQVQFDRQRWQHLLWEMAKTVEHVAPTREELESLPEPHVFLEGIFGKEEFDRSADFANFEQNFLHDVANRFRRVTRVRLYDPELDFRNLTQEQLQSLAGRQTRLQHGAKAIVQEYAIAIDSQRSLVPTTVPLILKTYRVTRGKDGMPNLEYDIYRVDRKVRELSAAAIQRFPDDAEGWAFIDFPNIPKGNRPAYRAPIRSEVCGRCHSLMPMSFAPAYVQPNVRAMLLNADDHTLARNRSVGHKLTSAEFVALWSYLNLDRP